METVPHFKATRVYESCFGSLNSYLLLSYGDFKQWILCIWPIIISKHRKLENHIRGEFSEY